MRIELSHDSTFLSALMNRLPEQLPYATALALTRTAQDAQAEIKRGLPRRFKLRNRWVEQGIRVKAARKGPAPEAVVHSRDGFMFLQEVGGTKLPHGRALAIPGHEQPDYVAGRSIRKANRPRALLAKPAHFVAPLRHGSKQLGIFQRMGRKRTRPTKYNKVTWRKAGRSGGRYGVARERQPIRLHYILSARASVEARFEFKATVHLVARRNIGFRFREALAEALAGARS